MLFVALNLNLTTQFSLCPPRLSKKTLATELISLSKPSTNKLYVGGSMGSIITSISETLLNLAVKSTRALLDENSCLEEDVKFVEFNYPFQQSSRDIGLLKYLSKWEVG